MVEIWKQLVLPRFGLSPDYDFKEPVKDSFYPVNPDSHWPNKYSDEVEIVTFTGRVKGLWIKSVVDDGHERQLIVKLDGLVKVC